MALNKVLKELDTQIDKALVRSIDKKIDTSLTQYVETTLESNKTKLERRQY